MDGTPRHATPDPDPELDGITAGDYLTWCRDPDPPALDLTLRSISIDADPLRDTITAILDRNQPPPAAPAAANAAGLPLSAGVQVHQLLADRPHAGPGFSISSLFGVEAPVFYVVSA
jgi:hypothetical protein